jgi:hypothetical protein
MVDLPPIEGSMAASESSDTFSGSGTTMITAHRYYTCVVEPTVEEFKKYNRDLRLALLAAMVTLHTVEYVMQNRAGDPGLGDDLVKEFSKKNADHFHFSVVRGFALASKHCRLTSLSGFHSGEHRSVAAGRVGEMEAGVTPLNEPGGIQVLWNEKGVYLSVALDGTLALFESTFPEIGSGGTSS